MSRYPQTHHSFPAQNPRKSQMAAAAAAAATLLQARTLSVAHHVVPTRPRGRLMMPPCSICASAGKGRGTAVAVARAAADATGAGAPLPAALLFDCDGVLVDTEKDGHRISFNDTFTEKELGVTWDVELYGELLKIGGGKERMTTYFNKTGWPTKAPTTDEERKEFIASLHKRKTELFMALIEKKFLPLRPGVQRLIDEALGKGVNVAVCSTSNEKAVSAIVSFLLGPNRAEKITIFAGDVVPCKKPDPGRYVYIRRHFYGVSKKVYKCLRIEKRCLYYIGKCPKKSLLLLWQSQAYIARGCKGGACLYVGYFFDNLVYNDILFPHRLRMRRYLF